MDRRVAVIGIGTTGFRAASPEVSYREMIYEAAVKAYSDAGLAPDQIGSFIACSEDISEGTSIFDEYCPDQIGGARRPVHSVSGDGLHGIITAAMNIQTGLFETALVECHSKVSNCIDPVEIMNYALDPIYNRPLGEHPEFIAGLEMRRYLYESKAQPKDCAAVVQKNRAHALKNPWAAYPANLELEEIQDSPATFDPLREIDRAHHADGASVVILASADWVKKNRVKNPVWVKGMGWISEDPGLEMRPWGRSIATQKAAKMAYKQAGIRSPRSEIDFAEVDDTYSYKELQHLEDLWFFPLGGAAKAVRSGLTRSDGKFPVNVSGGCLGMGNAAEASGLQRVLEIVTQLRGEAGVRQLKRVRQAVAQSWRGIPTTSCAVAVLSKGVNS
ncbi:MAG: acetyl-CoA acetyltransferase [Deltaproteobacteria bacterium]|nr:acetyl-CoA acetyltransferase [Deltaproteobacteria bacterium]